MDVVLCIGVSICLYSLFIRLSLDSHAILFDLISLYMILHSEIIDSSTLHLVNVFTSSMSGFHLINVVLGLVTG